MTPQDFHTGLCFDNTASACHNQGSALGQVALHSFAEAVAFGVAEGRPTSLLDDLRGQLAIVLLHDVVVQVDEIEIQDASRFATERGLTGAAHTDQ